MSVSFFLFFLEQIGSPSYARPQPAEYWRTVMKDEAMPEAIQGLMEVSESGPPLISHNNLKPDCHTSTATGHCIQQQEIKAFCSRY